MRRRILLALIAIGAAAMFVASASDHLLSAMAAGGGTPLAGGAHLEGRDPNAGIKHFWAVRTLGDKKIPQGAYERAKRQWDALPKVATYSGIPGKQHKGAPSNASSGSASKFSPVMLSPITSLNGVTWQAIGPDPIDAGGNHFWNGRVNSIAINPNNPNQIYIGTTGGGVWKTNDAGAHWTPLTDHQPMLAIGEPAAVAIDPNNTNTIYVGSSTQVNNSTGAQGIALNTTLGILKSTDAGGSWITLGSGFPAGNTGNASQFANTDIYAIIVDPANSNILYLAGSLGLWTSSDGGQNWVQGTNGGVGTAQSLVLDPSSAPGSRVLYAAVNSSGVWKTSDGGATWTQVLSTGTAAVASRLTAHNTSTSNAGIGKVAVTLAPVTINNPNPSLGPPIYITIEGNGGDFIPTPYTQILGIFESVDGGTTWTTKNTGAALQCQCFYTNTIAADPGSSGDGSTDIVYWGGTNEFRSADSGATFSDVTNGVHADSHAWAFVPQTTPSTVYSGNDGGIWRSTDSGATWTGAGGVTPATINGGGLQSALFYHVDVKRGPTADYSVGALQDNGTVQWHGSSTWLETFGGDGLIAVFDQKNVSTAYNVNDGGPQISTSNGDSGSWSDITNNIPHDPTTNNQVQTFSNTLNVDPDNGGYLYFGGAANQPTGSPKPTPVPGQLFQSTNSGGTWKQITNFTPIVNAGPTAIANNGNTVAVVDGGTKVYLTKNALAAGTPTFIDITHNLPGRAVTRLAFDPNDPTTLYAVLSGFSGFPGGHVFVFSIVGTSWTDISPALDVPFDGLALDGASSPTTIYAGSDLGVLRSIDGGNTWSTLDAIHFPNVPVTDLQINPAVGVMRASTFGRGVFEFAAATGPVITVNPQSNLQFGNVCLFSAATLDLQIINTGTSDLIVNSVARLAGSADFSVLSGPSTPVTVSPNATVDFMIQYNPTVAGAESATIRISSNDPNAPTVDLTANGFGAQPAISTIIASGGNFGNVCVGSQSELNLTIANPSACPLSVSGISSSNSTDFQVAAVVHFPLMVQPNGGSVQVPIQFDPQSRGAKTSSITVSSNAKTPAPAVPVSGNAPPGQIQVSGGGDFGNVCAGAGAQKTITVANVGLCNLHVVSASIDCPDFTIEGNPFPANISADFSLPLTIQFTPTSGGPKSCTLTITSDDPTNPIVTIPLTANTPGVVIDVPPDQNFPATVIQSVGACSSHNPFPVSNNGTCPLTITSVAIGGTNAADYSESGLPSLPTPLQAGHVLGEGNLNNLFKPTLIKRAEQATVTVTYEDDPITHHTSAVPRNLCGEGTSRGARVLVTAGGVPLASVDKIQLHRLNSNRKAISIDNVINATLQTVTQAAPCASFQFQREWGGVTNPIQLTAGDYQVTVSATVNGKKAGKTVSFTLGTCDFDQNIVVPF